MEKFINKYIKDVKNCITLNSKEEKEFLKSFKNDVLSAYDNEEFKTHNELIDVFGYPNEVAASYIQTVQSSRIAHYLKSKFVIISLIILLVISVVSVYVYDRYRLNKLLNDI